MTRTGFYWDERCFWHAGGNYALTMPIGGFVQPLAAGGLPESPETKRRLRNLMEVSGITADLHMTSAPAASHEDLRRVHPESYLRDFKAMSDAGGGELGLRTPFAQGGYEIAALSAGLASQALLDVMQGKRRNAYALSRPPGHHCLPDWPNGFCLMANIAIAIEAAQARGLAGRVAVIDWDVHHGNGTEHIYYERDDVLTISLHQERNYPLDTGDTADRGRGAGLGCNINLPLPPGTGHKGYLQTMERIVLPAVDAFAPDVIIVACGFDAGIYDPIARMLCTAETFGAMTRQVMDLADRLCDGRLLLVHEGGYSEAYVPFCGHRVMEVLSGSKHVVPDPMAATVAQRQPGARFDAFLTGWIDDLAEAVL
ncbi:class II histone deacetylase [Pseudooceanicola algae]|uniref:Histone deacetylase-like amidohydrolase n=1 Tax=Pseudooceanicola algae TaxID=1537215 RepID=A0A418SHX5_9RHOB|nr:class II histone deacetylase [Pseudooceanicola algae]QPM92090.1 Histone deacetylase-like amidohydrolase [Pseudooceanicola algae]